MNRFSHRNDVPRAVCIRKFVLHATGLRFRNFPTAVVTLYYGAAASHRPLLNHPVEGGFGRSAMVVIPNDGREHLETIV